MIKKYLFRQFISSFLSVFVTLFIISSIIILFQIAKITSYIELSLYELFKLYALMSVKLILFTIPISFFISCFMCILRLSKENEIIMLFSLGYSPKVILNFFNTIAIVISTILIIISLIFIPISFSLYDNFIDYKKAFSQINLKSNNFGQKIGNYIYFSDEFNEDIYKNIIIYVPKTDETNKQILIAKTGKIINDNSKITFKLDDVKIYNFKQNLEFLQIKELTFNSLIKSQNSGINSIKEYWKNYKEPSKSKELVIYILLSLLPITCVKFALAFSIISSRYEKSHEYLAILIFLLIYLTPMSLLLQYHFYTILLVFSISYLISHVCFKKKILEKY
ncbi:LptF/LptG family permease [Campylobacter sp. MG1]|uniref:LptF/LptG family permease n=1 Tax=Campylobacter sp. MG1 TaxID=2976332 RepID=UPI00226D03AE|nr:LptF/LptG family permease [Campylobacter sp. MG1]